MSGGGGGGGGARKSEVGFFGTNEEGARHGLVCPIGLSLSLSLSIFQFERTNERTKPMSQLITK